MTRLFLVPIGPKPIEWHWLEDGCRCGRKAQLRVNPRGSMDADPITYECRRCGILLATAYDVPSPERAMVLKAEAMRECRKAGSPREAAAIRPATVTNTHRGYRCRPDGRRYRLDAIGAWLKTVWIGHDDWQ